MRKRTGTIEQLKSGKWSVRLTYPDGSRERLPELFDTRDDANIARRIAVEELGLSDRESLTLAKWMPKWLDARERSGYADKGVEAYRSIWRSKISTSKFVSRPMRSVKPHEIRAWIDPIAKSHARQYTRSCLSVLRAAFASAVDASKIPENPVLAVRVPGRERGLVSSDEPWTYLTRDEMTAVRELATLDERLVIDAAWGMGLRSGELRALRLADVVVTGRDPHARIRFGGLNQPTKNRKTRIVPLFGVALEAMKDWIKRLPKFCPDNERGLVFPTLNGCYRTSHVLGLVYAGLNERGHCLNREDRFHELCRHAGLFDEDADRPLVWHSLRHTCASWLVSGWWGRAWTIYEVKELLGHSSITTTQRYAHLGETALKDAARATAIVQQSSSRPRRVAENKALGLGSQPVECSDRSQTILNSSASFGRLLDEFAAATKAESEDGMWRAARALRAAVLADPVVKAALGITERNPHAMTAATDLVDALTPLVARPPLATRRGAR